MWQIRMGGPASLLILGMAFAAFDAAAWRSTLYPENWTPGFTTPEGRFLHDFSYAGYHNGADPLPTDHSGPVFNVAQDFAADSSGAADATSAIQAAIDAAEAAGGGIIYLPSGLYRCDGLLQVAGSHIVIRGDGPAASYLYFTRYAGMEGQIHLAFNGQLASEPVLPLAVDGENRSRVVYVSNAAGLAVGDEVSVGWTITDAFVAEHGMSGTWYSFNGQWKPFFRREVTAIDTSVSPNAVTLDVPLRYPAKIRDGAGVRRESGYLTECGIEDLSMSNAVSYAAAWENERQHLAAFRFVKDSWIRNVHSFVSPAPGAEGYHLQNSGFYLWACKRITVADCLLEKAQNRGSGGCGYLYEIGASNEVLVRDCIARHGRHNFIQNWDFGTAGCVFLRCFSTGSRNVLSPDVPISFTAYCEFHHSLAMACLIDSCTLEDGWYGGNRGSESSGAGHTVTQSVYWNTTGTGTLRSWQFGDGYIVGTGPEITVVNALGGANSAGTDPEDLEEGPGAAAALEPQSLYLAQLERRAGSQESGNLGCGRPHGGLYAVGDDLCLVVPLPISLLSSFSWRKDGAPITLDGRTSGLNTRKLSINNLQLTDSGLYTCAYDDGSKLVKVFEARVTVGEQVPSLETPWFR